MDRSKNAPQQPRRFSFWEAVQFLEAGTLNSYGANDFLNAALLGYVRFEKKGSNGAYESVEPAAIRENLEYGGVQGRALDAYETTEDELRRGIAFICCADSLSDEVFESYKTRAVIASAVGLKQPTSGLPWLRARSRRTESGPTEIRPARPVQRAHTESRNQAIRDLALKLYRSDLDHFEKMSGKPDKKKLTNRILALIKKKDPSVNSLPGPLTRDTIRKALTTLKIPSGDLI